MGVSGLAVAEVAAGGILLWSGIRGSTISATLKATLAGNPGSAPDTEGITFGSSGAGTAGTSPGSAQSGTASQNYLLIANYLVGNGYSKAAAAGIVACIAGESAGNPESVQDKSNPGAGGEGLIQWTPGSSYGVPITGNASKDLQAQLPMILAYNSAQGGGLIGMLNSVSDPVQAADFYSQHFERPAVTNSDVVSSVATSVYASITTGATTGTTTTTTGTSSSWWVASFGASTDVYQAASASAAQAKHPTWTIAGPYSSKSAAGGSGTAAPTGYQSPNGYSY
jgi:hypothetical protein